MRVSLRYFIGTLLVVSFMSSASAAPWPPNGHAIAEHGIPPDIPACTSCHRNSFSGDPAKRVPSLRGKSAADLMDDLAAETANHGDHSKMSTIARHLDMAQRAAVTAYIASLSPRTPTP